MPGRWRNCRPRRPRAGIWMRLTRRSARARPAAGWSTRRCARAATTPGITSPCKKPPSATCAITWTSMWSRKTSVFREANDGFIFPQILKSSPRPRRAPLMEADYVIVSAGSAGCAMAYRLAEAGKSVLVIEHGGTDAGPFIQMPGALSYPMNMKRYDWGYQTEPEPHLAGRRLACPRGKVIGGSSSINGMVYVRGHARDYDHWRDQDGPLHVTRGPRDIPLTRACVEAGVQAGYPATADYNGPQQEGFGPFDMTVWQGARWSAAKAYLKPALERDNCDLIRAFARRVVIEDGRAVGVEVERGGKIEVIR